MSVDPDLLQALKKQLANTGSHLVLAQKVRCAPSWACLYGSVSPFAAGCHSVGAHLHAHIRFRHYLAGKFHL